MRAGKYARSVIASNVLLIKQFLAGSKAAHTHEATFHGTSFEHFILAAGALVAESVSEFALRIFLFPCSIERWE
jgi:hypothetical protein